jgi:hypothetical protein
MAPQEVLRYKDSRGDTVIFKFDLALLTTNTTLTNASQLPPSSTPRRDSPLSSAMKPSHSKGPFDNTTSATLKSTEIPGPISIFHEWRQDLTSKTNLISVLLDKEGAMERFARDRKPANGFILWEGDVREGGRDRHIRVRWVGFEKSEIGCIVESAAK